MKSKQSIKKDRDLPKKGKKETLTSITIFLTKTLTGR